MALTGAGCSTESGIPDYRGPEGRLRVPEPVRYRAFVERPEIRTRYWARSTVGWPRVADARPNAGHRALARLEREGVLVGVITQNVDGLHRAAGSRRTVDLHGRLAFVRCLECGVRIRRDRVQERLLALNPEWTSLARRTRAGRGVEATPDGDAALPDSAAEGFRVPGCTECEGVLKPDVVFFGENVPKPRVEEAWRLFGEADALLVVGSSLSVFSGRRFTQRAAKEGVPIGVVNIGPTRADEVAAAKVEGRIGEVLPRLAEGLLTPPSRPAARANPDGSCGPARHLPDPR